MILQILLTPSNNSSLPNLKVKPSRLSNEERQSKRLLKRKTQNPSKNLERYPLPRVLVSLLCHLSALSTMLLSNFMRKNLILRLRRL